MAPARDVADAPMRRCGLCGRISTRFYCYNEEPFGDTEIGWVCKSRIVCGLCLDTILSLPSELLGD